MRPVLLLIILSFSAIAVCAQGYVDILPDEVTKPYYSRRDSIITGAKTAKPNEWAGWYSIDVGMTWSQRLLWAPDVGFAAFRDTCSNGPRAWVNHGRVSFDGRSLILLSDRQDSEQHLLELDESELMPIKWDQQHWLVPRKDLALFAYAVNSRSGIEYEIGYLKDEDQDKRRQGAPNLPSEVKQLLKLAPIKVKVIAIDESKDDQFPLMTINAGRDKGVIEGMSFWLTGQKSIDARVIVAEVGDQTSKVEIQSVGRTADFEKEVVPKVGWVLTSRSKNPNLF